MPYRLPELRKAVAANRTILVVEEGEQKVDRLRDLGFTATCNAGGARKWSVYEAQDCGALRMLPLSRTTTYRAGPCRYCRRIPNPVQDKAPPARAAGPCRRRGRSHWLGRGGTKEQLAELITRQAPTCPTARAAAPSLRPGGQRHRPPGARAHDAARSGLTWHTAMIGGTGSAAPTRPSQRAPFAPGHGHG